MQLLRSSLPPSVYVRQRSYADQFDDHDDDHENASDAERKTTLTRRPKRGTLFSTTEGFLAHRQQQQQPLESDSLLHGASDRFTTAND
jgi:hypothetical protein